MPTMPAVKDFIDNENVKELVAITNRINIFNILGKDESETSDTLFMSWLFELDKGKNNCFARMFLKKIDFDFEFDYFEVKPEKTISSLSEMFDVEGIFSEIHTKKPDIAIIFYRKGKKNPCGLLLIENKINANESEKQTEGYAQFLNSLSSVPNKKGIFLTRKDDKPSSKNFKHFKRNDVLKKTVGSYLQVQIVSHGTNSAVIDLIRQYYEKLDIEDRQDEIINEIIAEFEDFIISEGQKIREGKKTEIPGNYRLTYNDLFDQCKAYSKTVYNNWQEYENFLADSKNCKFELVTKIKKINDILVDEYGFIPHYSPTNISFSLNAGLKMINTGNRMFAWLFLPKSGLKIGFAKDPQMNWSDFEKKIKLIFPGIRLVPPNNSYKENFSVLISSIEEFDKIVRPLIDFIKGYLLKPS